jgi:pimeloyl-ACP methyl ester carboxylesterase
MTTEGQPMECRLPDITVHYQVFGDGRPLIVLPGWPDDGSVPADYLEPVFGGRVGWKRIYVDLPGRGQTRGEPWITSNDEVLQVLLDLIDRIVPGERLVLAGHSAGGYLARAVLARRSTMIDGLLQVIPVMDPDGSVDMDPAGVTVKADAALVDRIVAELGHERAASFVRAVAVQDAGIYERFKALLPGIDRRDQDFLDRLVDTVSFPVDPPPEPFARPALFVLGRQDAVVGYRTALDLTEHYPRGTVAVLDRAGHALPWEQPAVFTALVRDWLDRVEEASPA